MKTLKTYGYDNKQNKNNLEVELYSVNDSLSARTLNRPVEDLLENQNNIYTLLNTVLKQTYGNVQDGIIPYVGEEMAPDLVTVESFLNNSNNFLRIPSGMFFSKKAFQEFENNPFYKSGEFNYRNSISKNFINDNFDSFVIDNTINTSLLERQIGNIIGLDLNDLTNDVKVNYKPVPFAYRLGLIGDDNFQIRKHNGSLAYAEDEDSNELFLADKDNINSLCKYYKISNCKKAETIINTPDINSETQNVIGNSVEYFKKVNNTTGKLDTLVPFDPNDNWEDLHENEYIFVNNINFAKIKVDSNGKPRFRNGFSVMINRNINNVDETINLPNKQKNSYWNIYFDLLNYDYYYNNKIVLKITYNGQEIETITDELQGTYSINELNNKIYNIVLNNSNKFTASLYNTEKTNYGVCIENKVQTIECNNYVFSAYILNDDNTKTYLKNRDTSNTQENNLVLNVPCEKSVDQKYCYSVAELINIIIGNYDAYSINTSDINKYLTTDTLLNLSSISNAESFYVYYDLKQDYLNADDNYDKNGGFLLSLQEKKDDNYILVYKIKTQKNTSIPYETRVVEITNHLTVLDSRLIATKRAEFNTLDVDSRSEFHNWFSVGNENRKIEITEKNENADENEMRFVSPVTRITDKDNLSEPQDQEFIQDWNDSLESEGDISSDFRNVSFPVRDFTTNELKYYTHQDSSNLGIVVDTEKGVRIFSKRKGAIIGDYSYSKYAPIEIENSNGNINLFTNGNESKINLANFKDTLKNLIDLKGLFRVRSKNGDEQLTVRKIAKTNIPTNYAGINFTVGTSTPKDDFSKDFSNENSIQNIVMGSIRFGSGPVKADENNRFFELNLSRNEENKDFLKVLTARNNIQPETKKHTVSVYGDLVPALKGIIGTPINSRTYKTDETQESSSHIQYTRDILDLQADPENGTSLEYLSNEDRWLASFIQNGYFGKITLADRVSDVNNSDSRNGALRMGNSNIYDVSSIYINNESNSTNVGTINFDNKTLDNRGFYSENTIYSKYDDTNETNGLKFILKRQIGVKDYDTNNEKSDNYVAAEFTPSGNFLNKNTYTKRQLWVNVHPNASTEDNSSLVVKGQTVLNGELVVGKEIGTTDVSSNETIFANKSDDYKKYNSEYNKALYLARIFGHSYFDENITLNPNKRFTEDTTFNKSVVINNNNYNDKKFNEFLTLADDDRAVSNIKNNTYFTQPAEDISKSNGFLPRHHKAFEVVSGLIKLGSSCENLLDSSDVELNGSQWIRRRLSISENDSLRNSYMFNNRLGNETSREQKIIEDENEFANPDYQNVGEQYLAKLSPSLYIEKASQFDGDVVFGGGLKQENVKVNSFGEVRENGEIDSISCLMASHIGSDEAKDKGVKAIFWGRNKPAEANAANKITNYKTDFDFHGKSLFDGDVFFGLNSDYGTTFPRIYNEPTVNIFGGLNLYTKEKDVSCTSRNILLNAVDPVSNSYTRLNLNKEYSGQTELLASGSTVIKSQLNGTNYVNNFSMNDEGTSLESTNLSNTISNSFSTRVGSDTDLSYISANTDDTSRIDIATKGNLTEYAGNSFGMSAGDSNSKNANYSLISLDSLENASNFESNGTISLKSVKGNKSSNTTFDNNKITTEILSNGNASGEIIETTAKKTVNATDYNLVGNTSSISSNTSSTIKGKTITLGNLVSSDDTDTQDNKIILSGFNGISINSASITKINSTDSYSNTVGAKSIKIDTNGVYIGHNGTNYATFKDDCLDITKVSITNLATVKKGIFETIETGAEADALKMSFSSANNTIAIGNNTNNISFATDSVSVNGLLTCNKGINTAKIQNGELSYMNIGTDKITVETPDLVLPQTTTAKDITFNGTISNTGSNAKIDLANGVLKINGYTISIED